MLKKIEYLIPAALEAIKEHLEKKYPNGIPSGYQGALAGFGTSLLQMGLLPTLAVYLDKTNAADIDRCLLLKTLLAVLSSEDSWLSEEVKKLVCDLYNSVGKDTKEAADIVDRLLRRLGRDDSLRKEFSRHLMQAALAMKLAIRTYKLT